MSVTDRLLAGPGFAGPGFAVFTRRPTFAFSTIGHYLTADRAITHVLFVPNAATHAQFTEGITRVCGSLDVALTVAPWESYGTPANVARVEALPSEGLAIVLADQRRTLGNRLDVRRTYMRRKAARKRIVVDVLPYEVDAWRVYFPFAFFDRSLLGYHHSYAIEQDYERFRDGGLDVNPCDPERIAAATWQAAIVDDVSGLGPFTDIEIKASAEHHAAYAVFRDSLFESEKSIASVKSKLARWISERYPKRAIPHDLKAVYAADFRMMVRTDLPFDCWLAREITGLAQHTNTLIAAYKRRQREAGET